MRERLGRTLAVPIRLIVLGRRFDGDRLAARGGRVEFREDRAEAQFGRGDDAGAEERERAMRKRSASRSGENWRGIQATFVIWTNHRRLIIPTSYPGRAKGSVRI